MSTVYRAFDQTLERQVAIKLLHRQIADDPDQLERFRREARAVAQLSHPHIVTRHRRGRGGGPPVHRLRVRPGRDAQGAHPARGPLDVDEAAAYAIEIARALGYAHSRNIVHRDVKPQNVLIDDEGSAKITDFGIARTLDEEGLTADGRVLGTTDYVSPEQALGHQVTGQSDLYSLGIVLFEMLTGDVPFKGENQVAVAMKHVREPLPDVQELRPEVCATLAAVVDRATAKDLDRRYAERRRPRRRPRGGARHRDRAHGHVARRGDQRPAHAAPEQQRRVPLRLRHPLWILAAAARRRRRRRPESSPLGADQTTRGTGTQGAPAEQAPGLEAGLARHGSARLRPARRPRRERRGGERSRSTATRARRGAPSATTAACSTSPAPTSRASGCSSTRSRRSPRGSMRICDADPRLARGDLRLREQRPRELAQPGLGQGRPRRSTCGRDRERVDLDTAGKAFRYYLIWITKVPPEGRVSISEVYLYRQK